MNCPHCDEEITLPATGDNGECPECGGFYTISRDADFPGDGSGWHDKTRVFEAVKCAGCKEITSDFVTVRLPGGLFSANRTMTVCPDCSEELAAEEKERRYLQRASQRPP